MLGIYIAITIAMMFVGGYLSRMHGGAYSDSNPINKFIDKFSLEAWLLSLPILPLVIRDYSDPAQWGVALVCYAFSVLGIRLGHGQYMTLPYSFKVINAERIDPFVEIFFDKDPRVAKYGAIMDSVHLEERIEFYGKDKLHLRNLFGKGMLGVISLFPAALMLAYQGLWLPAAILAPAGFLDSLAYEIGYRINGTGDEATALGETLRGVFRFLTFSIVGILLWEATAPITW